MELSVFWLQLAEEKLDDIYAYYREKAGKRIAKNLILGIINTTVGLENHPESGQVETYLQHRKQEFRYLVFKNYKIIYWINSQSARIEIANVFDTRQNPEVLSKTK